MLSVGVLTLIFISSMLVWSILAHAKTSVQHQRVLRLLQLPTRFITCLSHTGDGRSAEAPDTGLHPAITVNSLDLNPVDCKLCCVLQVSFKVVILLRALYSNFVSCVDASQSETAWFTVEPKGVSRQRDDTTLVYCYRRWCWHQRWRGSCGVTRRCRVEQWPFHVTTRLSYSSRCHSTTLWLVVGPLTTTTLNSVVSTSHHHHSSCIDTFPVSDAD